MTQSSYLTIRTSLDGMVRRERKFHIRRIVGSEFLCKDFSYRLSVSSLERLGSDEMEELTGSNVTVELAHSDHRMKKETRYINGIVYRLDEIGRSRTTQQPDIWRYEMTIGSWLAQLEDVYDCRIFQKSDNTRLKIVIDLLRELGCHDLENRTQGRFPTCDYKAMVNEAVPSFISRLLYADGIFWYFEHREKRHILVFHNDTTTLPLLDSGIWNPQDSVQRFCRETVHRPVHQVVIAACDPENPPVKRVQRKTGLPKGFLTDYQYPGDFKKREEGEVVAERQVHTLRNHRTVYYGESTVRMMAVGHRFELKAPQLNDLHQQRFLIKELTIDATDHFYQNRLVALSAREHAYPVLDEVPAKPAMVGSQTAIVVGEAGVGKVQTDKKGRVKVRFHFDHISPKNSSNTSAYIPVAGICAGDRRGCLFTPRIGEEVNVIFSDNGDPDKPLIIGSFFSRDRMPPLSEAFRPYRSVIKTGSETKANAIVLDETPGKEHFVIQGKRDLHFKVGGNLDIDVENDININARKITIIIRKSITIEAGGNIVNLALDSIRNTAGSNITSLALGGVISVAGGLVTNLAGCSETNSAIFSVENTSEGKIQCKTETLLANTAVNAVGHTAPTVVNKGDLAIINSSKGGIVNDGKEVKAETLMQKVKIKESSLTETGSFKIKGLMSKIN